MGGGGGGTPLAKNVCDWYFEPFPFVKKCFQVIKEKGNQRSRNSDCLWYFAYSEVSNMRIYTTSLKKSQSSSTFLSGWYFFASFLNINQLHLQVLLSAIEFEINPIPKPSAWEPSYQGSPFYWSQNGPVGCPTIPVRIPSGPVGPSPSPVGSLTCPVGFLTFYVGFQTGPVGSPTGTVGSKTDPVGFPIGKFLVQIAHVFVQIAKYIFLFVLICNMQT